MKILVALIAATSTIAMPAFAAEKFALPDLTVEAPRPPGGKSAASKDTAGSALNPARSQWNTDPSDKPKSFGDLSNSCHCSVNVKAREGLVRPALGANPFESDE